VVGDASAAVLNEDLRVACLGALAIARQAAESGNPSNSSARAFAAEHTWRKCTLQFLANIAVEPPEDQ
jgi:hypothetical protein